MDFSGDYIMTWIGLICFNSSKEKRFHGGRYAICGGT